MGALKILYADVFTKLKEIAQFKHVAVWNNQTDNEETEYPFNYPAVFLDFSSIEWNYTFMKPIQENITAQQSGTVTVTIRVAYHSSKTETEIFSPILDLCELIYAKLQGLSSIQYSPLIRGAERQDVNHDSVSVWEIDYITNVTDGGEDAGQIDATEGGEVEIGIDITTDLDIDNFIIRTGDGEV